MRPEHDCPKCSYCGGPGVPPRAWTWNHRADKHKGHNLACPACGSGWVGTPEEVAQAERAQLAWEAKERAEVENGRRGVYALARIGEAP